MQGTDGADPGDGASRGLKLQGHSGCDMAGGKCWRQMAATQVTHGGGFCSPPVPCIFHHGGGWGDFRQHCHHGCLAIGAQISLEGGFNFTCGAPFLTGVRFGGAPFFHRGGGGGGGVFHHPSGAEFSPPRARFVTTTTMLPPTGDSCVMGGSLGTGVRNVAHLDQPPGSRGGGGGGVWPLGSTLAADKG